jgi:hypothetical protein
MVNSAMIDAPSRTTVTNALEDDDATCSES